MIKIYIPENSDAYDPTSGEFTTIKGGIFSFENSLKSISKWEARHQKRWLDERVNKTDDELLDYYKCMCITPGFKVEMLNDDIIKILNEYVQTEHTGTTIHNHGIQNGCGSVRNSGISSEQIYAKMVMAGIPFECDKWEIHRLLKLIECVNILSGGHKMGKTQSAVNAAKINEQRLKNRAKEKARK